MRIVVLFHVCCSTTAVDSMSPHVSKHHHHHAASHLTPASSPHQIGFDASRASDGLDRRETKGKRHHDDHHHTTTTLRKVVVVNTDAMIAEEESGGGKKSTLRQPSLKQLDNLLVQLTNETVPAVDHGKIVSRLAQPMDWWSRYSSNWLAWLAVCHLVLIAFWTVHEIRRKQVRFHACPRRKDKKHHKQDFVKTPNTMDSTPKDDGLSFREMLVQLLQYPNNNCLHSPHELQQQQQQMEDSNIAIPRLDLSVLEQDTSSVPRYVPTGESCASSDICSTIPREETISVCDTSRSRFSFILPTGARTCWSDLRFSNLLTRSIRTPSSIATSGCASAAKDEDDGGLLFNSATSSVGGNSDSADSLDREPVKVCFPNGIMISTSGDNLQSVRDIIEDSCYSSSFSPSSSASSFSLPAEQPSSPSPE